MKTEKTELTQSLKIWAIPQSKWHRENYPDDPPFYYAVRTDTPWGDGAVLVHEEDIVLTVPAGIDLTLMGIKTLQEAQAEIRAEAQRKFDELQEQIDALLLLEHKPVDLEVVAE